MHLESEGIDGIHTQHRRQRNHPRDRGPDIETRYIQRSFGETWCHTVSGTPKGTITLTEEECTTSHALALKQYDEAKARLDSIKHVSSIFFEKFLEDSDFAQD